MSLRAHIDACNRHDLAGFRPFEIAGARVGWVRHALARRLAERPATFAVTDDRVRLADALTDFQARSAAVAEALAALADSGDLPRPLGEDYPVGTGFLTPPLMRLDRRYVPTLGVTAYGLHVNGYVATGAPLALWVARRARDRAIAPGKLDNLIGGGMALGLTLADNLVKEGAEEAGLDAATAARARPAGVITYTIETPAGLKPDVLFVYDLALPEAFQPRNTDGEVEAFHRWPAAQVVAQVRDGDAFKANVNLVIIDFAIRHGLITPDEPDYIALCYGLRR